MSRTGLVTVAAALMAAAVVTACSTTTTGTPVDPTYPAVSADASPDVVVAVRIAGGNVTPTNARAEAEVGQPVVIKIDSDAADELHVHSDPSRTFTVEPTAGQEFRFLVSVPGRVDVELHHAGKTVVTLLIRP